MPLLLGVGLLDELYSGVPSVAAAEIQAAFAASYAVTASALLLVPSAVALAVEPLLFVLADRHPRRWFVCGGLLAMALAAFLAAAADDVVMLGAALCLAYVGSGCGVALSQATLVDARPRDRERVLNRWVLFGEIGDLLAPALLAALAAAQLGYRAAYVGVGAVVLVIALLLWRQPFPAAASVVDADDPAEAPSVWAALAEALRNRRLLTWLAAAALCDLLDELLVVFASLHVRAAFPAAPVWHNAIIGAGLAGSLLGAALADRLLVRLGASRLLLLSCAASAGCHVAWLLAPTPGLSALGFFAVGLTAAPMYPIASARAYAQLPGRSGTVNAAAHLFTPLTLAAPGLLGLVADRAGTQAALALLLLQPLGVAVIALRARRAER